MANYEIERKYLIRMPDPEFLRRQTACAVWEIEQIYLVAKPGSTRRVRRVTEGGQTRYYRTFKVRITGMKAEEDEGCISCEQYETYLREADAKKRPILKTRYRIPHEGQLLEIDVYPFWTDRAVLEIELESEAEAPHIPEWLHVIKEVTDDYAYKNVSLAERIPMDEI